jgi:hypothetical protein
LELQSYRFGKEHTPVNAKPEVQTEGGRISYQWDAHMQEWFLNDERGLEHGFGLRDRPSGAGNAVPLEVVLGVRGNLRPALSADAQTVQFRECPVSRKVPRGACRQRDSTERS